MKRIFLLCTFLPVFSFAQETATPAAPETAPLKNELGFNLFSITDLTWGRPVDANLHYKASFNFANGIYYKRHFGKNALRFSSVYNQEAEYVSESGMLYYYNSAGKMQLFEIRAGYQRQFFTGKFQPYVFSDLVYTYSSHKGNESYYGDFNSGTNVPYSKTTNAFGISAGGGLRYQVLKNVSLTCEVDANGAYAQTKDRLHPSSGPYSDRNWKIDPLTNLGFAVAF